MFWEKMCFRKYGISSSCLFLHYLRVWQSKSFDMIKIFKKKNLSEKKEKSLDKPLKFSNIIRLWSCGVIGWDMEEEMVGGA